MSKAYEQLTLLEQLRMLEEYGDPEENPKMMGKAADEIERLQALVAELEKKVTRA